MITERMLMKMAKLDEVIRKNLEGLGYGK